MDYKVIRFIREDIQIESKITAKNLGEAKRKASELFKDSNITVEKFQNTVYILQDFANNILAVASEDNVQYCLYQIKSILNIEADDVIISPISLNVINERK